MVRSLINRWRGWSGPPVRPGSPGPHRGSPAQRGPCPAWPRSRGAAPASARRAGRCGKYRALPGCRSLRRRRRAGSSMRRRGRGIRGGRRSFARSGTWPAPRPAFDAILASDLRPVPVVRASRLGSPPAVRTSTCPALPRGRPRPRPPSCDQLHPRRRVQRPDPTLQHGRRRGREED